MPAPWEGGAGRGVSCADLAQIGGPWPGPRKSNPTRVVTSRAPAANERGAARVLRKVGARATPLLPGTFKLQAGRPHGCHSATSPPRGGDARGNRHTCPTLHQVTHAPLAAGAQARGSGDPRAAPGCGDFGEARSSRVPGRRRGLWAGPRTVLAVWRGLAVRPCAWAPRFPLSPRRRPTRPRVTRRDAKLSRGRSVWQAGRDKWEN